MKKTSISAVFERKFIMKITNCKIKKETIVYEVLTSGNQ
ncbi:hypothetical protein LMP33_14185, partial [Staphylococcus aureus]|nr:hypothetical protein [Staphylococcus aureus]